MFEIVTRFAEYLDKVTFLTYPVSLFLGFLAGMTAITCCLPIIPAVAGFVIGRGDDRRRVILVPFFMMLGTIAVLVALGITVSLAGLTLQKMCGRYWFYFAGAVSIIMGLFILGVIRLPARAGIPKINRKGFLGSFLFGLCIGGVMGFGSSCCLPILPVVLTYAAIKGRPLHGALILGTFAVGQSIPLFAIGLFSNLLSKLVGKWTVYVKWIVGILLLVAGAYFIRGGK